MTPVPESDSPVGELLALLTKDAFPLAAPLACGAKDAVNVLLAPGAIVSGIAALTLKPEPVTFTEETTTFAFPELESVTFFVLLAPTVTFPKPSGFGETLSVPIGAATPEPVSEITGADPPALLAMEADPVAVPVDCGLNTKDAV